MDIDTAKTLVSAILVVAIAAFSYVTVEALVSQVARDLKAGWAERARTERDQPTA